jgi:hypothetical protein
VIGVDRTKSLLKYKVEVKASGARSVQLTS